MNFTMMFFFCKRFFAGLRDFVFPCSPYSPQLLFGKVIVTVFMERNYFVVVNACTFRKTLSSDGRIELAVLYTSRVVEFGFGIICYFNHNSAVH